MNRASSAGYFAATDLAAVSSQYECHALGGHNHAGSGTGDRKRPFPGGTKVHPQAAPVSFPAQRAEKIEQKTEKRAFVVAALCQRRRFASMKFATVTDRRYKSQNPPNVHRSD
jgi:hypothetical protein